MIKYIKDEFHYSEVLSLIESAKKTLDISTANFKDLQVFQKDSKETESVLALLNRIAMSGVSIRILCSKPTANFLYEMKQYPSLSDNINVTVKVCLRVHMKMIVIDGKYMYLGSANMTGAAMGIRGVRFRNFEAGILMDMPEMIDEALGHFNSAWDDTNCDRCGKLSKCEGTRCLSSGKSIRQRNHSFQVFSKLTDRDEQIEEVIQVLSDYGYRNIKRKRKKADIGIDLVATYGRKKCGICFIDDNGAYHNQSNMYDFYGKIEGGGYDRGIFISIGKLTTPSRKLESEDFKMFSSDELISMFP